MWAQCVEACGVGNLPMLRVDKQLRIETFEKMTTSIDSYSHVHLCLQSGT